MKSQIQRIIWGVATQFKEYHPNISYEVEDLVHEAYLKLPEIKEKFNSKKGSKFSTFLWYRLEFHFMLITRNDRSKVVTQVETIPEVPVEHHNFPPKFLSNLSENAKRYIETILEFPDELKRYLAKGRSRSGKNEKHVEFKYRVGAFLGLSKTEVKQIQEEIKDKFIQ